MQDDDGDGRRPAPPSAGAAEDAAPAVRTFFAHARALLVEDDQRRRSKDRRTQFNEIVTAYNAAAATTPAVVVVGEVGRGKSTLVNALLGQELSPSGPAETTGTYLAFEPASDDLPAGAAEIEQADGTRRREAARDLERWVRIRTDDGGADEAPGVAVVLGARVGVAEPPFPGTVIVDTPGTGGLDPNHARVALLRAQRASILLMVTDAGAPIARPALEFLRQCSAHVASVVIVVTKIDNDPSGWPAVVEADRAALRAAGGPALRDAPIVAVSARDRLSALAATTPERAARRYAASRFDELLATVRGMLADGDSVARANAVRRMQAVLEDIARVLDEDVAALRSPAAAGEAAAALQALRARKEQGAFWRLDLDTAIGRASRAVRREAAARMQAFGERWQARIDRNPFGIGRSRAQRLHTDLAAELLTIVEDLREVSRSRLTEALTGILQELGLPEALDAVLVQASEREVQVGPPRSASAQLDLSAAMIGYSGFRLATLAGTGTAAMLNPGLLGVGLAAGAGMILLNVLMRGGHARKAAMQANLTRVLAEMRTELADDFADAVLELKPTLLRIIDAAMTKSIAELTQRVQAARAAQQAGGESREDAVAELEHRAAAVRRTAAEADAAVRAILHRAATPAEPPGTSGDTGASNF